MNRNELQSAADLLVKNLLKVKDAETVVITADMLVEPDLVDALSRAVTEAGGKRLTVWMDTPEGVSEAADKDLPGEALTALLCAADVWIELNNHWLLYSNIYYQAMRTNKKLRHMELTGCTPQTLIECVGKIDYDAMREFTVLLRDKLKTAKKFRFTSARGENVTFVNQEDQPVSAKFGVADKPGTHLFVGQIGWLPQPDSINGTLVFDGSIAPDIGILEEPICMTVENGNVVEITGGRQAKQYEDWLRGYGHPQMLRVAHTGIGFNPGARIIGDILLDQRFWGSTTWGFGSIGAGLLPPSGVKAPAHSDAVCLDTTVEADGVIWLKDGRFVEPELAAAADKLLKAK